MSGAAAEEASDGALRDKARLLFVARMRRERKIFGD
jgi:hypothetical protein